MADRSPLPRDDAAAAYVLHVHPNHEVWTWAAAVAIAAELRRELSLRPRARLLLSGGGTPGPVYRALSQAPLEWERVDVGLVDERWLLPDDPDSNAWLVHRDLLRDHAAVAHFEPMTQPGRHIEGAVATANAHARNQAAIAVLGMGEDGHVASLFPGMEGFDRILASPRDYAVVDAHDCPGARQWPRRISLTPYGLARIPHRLLLLQGERKRMIFEQAVASNDPQRWPVLLALDSKHGRPLEVHWCE
ncbi:MULTISPECIES: 6-phosphogluconolactonase [unclassified Lysobacter]|uniref:6-phosphogluconolactonase n=1 Tax=unclassified Lysobacter TaxID=2635362 RepID=UPI001C2378A0|nr:6-phosphogluconolactonase [Lysobacter sp. MMG2]MBU8974731.1 6-phosphogluconolactonase [Lysobacter sp. MMG2]